MSSPTISRLFQPFRSKALELKNRIVMAPMTRSRAVEANTPNALMAEYRYGYVCRPGVTRLSSTERSGNAAQEE